MLFENVIPLSGLSYMAQPWVYIRVLILDRPGVPSMAVVKDRWHRLASSSMGNKYSYIWRQYNASKWIFSNISIFFHGNITYGNAVVSPIMSLHVSTYTTTLRGPLIMNTLPLLCTKQYKHIYWCGHVALLFQGMIKLSLLQLAGCCHNNNVVWLAYAEKEETLLWLWLHCIL